MDQLCDRESRLTDLSESWSHKELLYNRLELINREQIIHQHTEKEVHLLSGQSELQPVTIALPHNKHGIITQYTPKGKDQDLLQPPDASEAQKLTGPTQIQ